MGKYKLVYFNVRARAEVARMLFANAGQEYEDKRITREEWPEIKKTTLFGSMPYLEVDGETICQSQAIERFLARRFGLAGKTDIEQAKVDMILECMEDTIKMVPTIFRAPDEEKKEALKKQMEEELVGQMTNLEKLLKSNNGGDGFFVGKDVTAADLSVAHFLTFPGVLGVNNNLDNYPKLKALKQRVESLPKIAAWIAKRPETPY